MEKGLPNQGSISIRRKGGYVNDLVAHRQIKTQSANDGIRVEVSMGPGGGKVLMITERPIAKILLDAPESSQPGKQVDLNITVGDETGRAIDAVIPLHVGLLDPQQREAEFSGYYAAQDGKASVTFDLASNDTTGQWTIRVTELASGLTTDHHLRVDP